MIASAARRAGIVVVAVLLGVVALLAIPTPAHAVDGCGIDPICIGKKVVGGGIASVAGDAITALANAVLGALSHAIEWAATLWVGVGTPSIADASTQQAAGTVAYLQQNLLTFTGSLAVLSVLIGGIRVVVEEQKSSSARQLGTFLVKFALVAGGGAFAASVLVGGCDQIASYFIDQADGSTGFANHLASYLGLVGRHGGPTGFTAGLAGTVDTAVIAIVLGLLAFVASVIQIMLMLVRGAMLILLIGTLPLVAAFSNTEMGYHWFRRSLAWILAFALYKPAAAIIYAAAFNLQTQAGALSLLDGVMMLILAILALPALLRFLVPATSALAGGGGAGGLAAAGVGAAAMRMPSGAAPVAPASNASYNQGQAGSGQRESKSPMPTGSSQASNASAGGEAGGTAAGGAAASVAGVEAGAKAVKAAKSAAENAVSDASEES